MAIGIRDIDAKYDVLEKMGEGGMGAVYKARHRLLDELRVIKTIRPHLRSDEDLQQRFLREARVAAKMRHPNLATIHDFAFTDDGTAYIVMDFIDGQNLRQFQRQGGRLAISEVVTVAQQALDALAYLHRKSFVHRDISSDNMMIGWPGGEPKVTLIDLGLAKSLEDSQHYQTKTGMVVGKVRYISPEQLNSGSDGVTVDARADLYSFGVVLYELLTRELPITGDDDLSLIAGHLYRSPRPFAETDPGREVSEPLRRVVMKALAKDPATRWQSATELSNALERSVRIHSTRPVADGPEGYGAAALDDDRTRALPRSVAPERTDGDEATLTMDVAEAHRTREAPQPATGSPRSVGEALGGPPPPPVSGPAPASAAPASAAPASASANDRSRATAPPAPPGTIRSSPPLAILAAVAAALFLVALGGWWLSGTDRRSDGATDGVVASSAAERAVERDTRGPDEAALDRATLGRFYAVVVGNNRYEKLPSLTSAVADARAVADLLETRFGFDVTVVENAGREALLEAIDERARIATARDNLLVYYAGHGTVQGFAEYWQPIDADPVRTENWISTRHELADLLDRSEARHVLVVADSCFAGAALDAPPLPVAPSLELRELALRPSRLVLASGTNSPVLDSGGDRHSIFARAFLDALEASDRMTPISALYERLRPVVVEAAESLEWEQTPVLAPIPKSVRDEGGELVLAPIDA